MTEGESQGYSAYRGSTWLWIRTRMRVGNRVERLRLGLRRLYMLD